MRNVTPATVVFILTACIGPAPERILEASDITVSPTNLTLSVGEKEQLFASISPSEATNQEIRWESDNEDVAIVDSQGLVAAFKEGSANISAIVSANGIKSVCSISVIPQYVAVEAIYLESTRLNLRTGDHATITPKILPDNATNQIVSWDSSDSSIATVNDGQIVGVNPGRAIITASVEGKSSTCVVIIKERDIPDGATDLGLSVYWALCNIGASSPEQFGDSYTWGEIEPRQQYFYPWTDYRFFGGENRLITKYCPQDKSESWGGVGKPDDKIVLEKEDDAASQILGGNWRMPTIEEIGELLSTMYNDQYEWTWEVFGDINNSGITVCGWKIRYKKNGNSIIIPGASVTYTHGGSGAIYYYGGIWSSSLCLNNPKTAYYSYIAVYSDCSASPFEIRECDRSIGFSIRPVSN